MAYVTSRTGVFKSTWGKDVICVGQGSSEMKMVGNERVLGNTTYLANWSKIHLGPKELAVWKS